MKLFYRLVLLDLVLTFPMDLSILRDIASKTQTLSNQAILLIEFVLLAANFAIVWKVARQSGILPFVGSRSRRFIVWAAWITGPLMAAIVPLAIAALIIKRTFVSIVWAFLYLYWAGSTWLMVRRSQERQTL